MLGSCRSRLHNASMTTSITIRNIPDEVRDELAARAARAGRSLQEHLRIELIELASRPSVDEVLARVRARTEATGTRLSAEQILEYRDADRK
jgi:antitoxin FitA